MKNSMSSKFISCKGCDKLFIDTNKRGRKRTFCSKICYTVFIKSKKGIGCSKRPSIYKDVMKYSSYIVASLIGIYMVDILSKCGPPATSPASKMMVGGTLIGAGSALFLGIYGIMRLIPLIKKWWVGE